ncbi:aldehyde dehydrogenase family protein [Pseudonocardia spinosispora]|uniref:aldehyde dehydrogenase family protein n=1 Tax=Pseudonocardia spinosispora TaxID=103441 RepID=UPI00146FAEB8|nr:aldehyde dehydrogenase family protein [Pseudonocardia spinosispora]
MDDWVKEVSVYNPGHSTEIVGFFPELGPEHIDRAVRAAERAQVAWAGLGAAERFTRLSTAGEAADAVPGVAELLARETGKTLAEAQLEPGFFAMLLQSFAHGLDWLDGGDVLEDVGQGAAWRFREPFGVVGAIAPSNYPLLLSTLKVVPALLTGNSVVLLAPPTAPFGTVRFLQAAADALPPGVLTVLTGSGPVLGQRLAEHERVRKISFTGSVPTGQAVARAAAANLKSVGLELGGNDPGIVLDDCVLDDRFFRSIAGAAFAAAGQVCFALKRLYVPRRLMPTIVDGLTAVLDGYVVGDQLDPAVTMGPVHTEASRARVRRLVDEARAGGGVVHTRGSLAIDEDEGWYLRPVVVADAPSSSRLVQEEQFGPALPIVGYDSIEHATAMANETIYGLGSSIWTEDESRGVELSRRLVAGGTFINGHGFFAMDFRICLTGAKLSGVGQDGAGAHALSAYTEPHAVSVTPS